VTLNKTENCFRQDKCVQIIGICVDIPLFAQEKNTIVCDLQQSNYLNDDIPTFADDTLNTRRKGI